jgi:ABC-type sugar transport system substrate-binding protein
VTSTHETVTTMRRRRARHRVAAGFALLVAVCLVAACSSSKSSGSGSNNSGGGSSDAGLAQAKAIVAKYSTQPTTLPITEKITKPIPTGRHIHFISCGSPECAQEGQIIKQATDALGWTLTVINTSGTPETQKAAFAQVVREKSDAVLYSAINKSTFASELPQLKANGTFVAACCITDAVGNGIDYANEVPEQTAEIGELKAAWIVADSNADANIVYVDLPAFSILATSRDRFKSSLPTLCPKCRVDVLEIPVTALGVDVPTRIVAYLRAHPKVKYIAMSTDGITIGLPAALKAAGLNDVKIIGQGATATNLQYIHSGQEGASIAFPFYEALWAMVDAVARHEAGVPLAPSAVPSLWLLTKDTAPTTNKLFPVVQGSEAQFKSLWGVG